MNPATPTSPPEPILPLRLHHFIARWGELASHWGLNRTEVQIHSLLLLSPRPLDAEEISDALGIARSNVSMSLKELNQWGFLRESRALGSRRVQYEVIKDVWETFRLAVREQKRREIDPIVTLLRETVAELDPKGKKDAYPRERLAEHLDFFETLCAWYEDMRPVPTPMIKTVLKLGRKMLRLIGLK
jgi:DNA-binding transcriptional regulator GbsR (MarR family)